MTNPLTQFFLTDRVGEPTRATFAVRAMTGAVFVVSGAIKFLYENAGAARFAKIGFPAPAAVSAFVGSVEIVAGALLIAGLFVRLASVPLIIDMSVAIATTKLPLLMGGGPEIPPSPPQSGLWAFLYQGRLDMAMLVSCASLVVMGAGLLSVDAYLSKHAHVTDGRPKPNTLYEPAHPKRA